MSLEDNVGEILTMKMGRKVDFGVYLRFQREEVLLPGKEIPEDLHRGDEVEVFLYRDSRDRLVTTMKKPLISKEYPTVLKVSDVSEIGAFMDWGLPKDLFLPYREQTCRVKKGGEYLVALYVDKSRRLCATMKVYNRLRTDSPYAKGDVVEGIIYEVSGNFGVFVAVDDCFSALIPRQEAYGNLDVGNRVHARVTEVREDGKLTLSVREKTSVQMGMDSRKIMTFLEENQGILPLGDRSGPEEIKELLSMSKNAFKRAAGSLYRSGKIVINDKSIEIKQK